MLPSECPVCGNHLFRQAVDLAVVEDEIRLRDNFVYSRLRRRAPASELKDLVDFMHGEPAPLLECLSCGLLIRAEAETRAADSYEEDPNDADLMQEVYPRFLKAFRQKRIAYKDRLRPHAQVLEIGPHLGAFLQTAEEWNWQPIGIDIGKDTSGFIRRHGLTVRNATIEDARFPAGTFEAVFLWNCFEQLPDPVATLAEVRRVLKPHGLLVIRVPNALPYLELRSDTRTLAYNNLLGFPYLYGYTIDNLNRLLARAGFTPEAEYNSELITLPFPDQSRSVRREQLSVSRQTAEQAVRETREQKILMAPWMEVIYRRASAEIPDSQVRLVPEPVFLPRAA